MRLLTNPSSLDDGGEHWQARLGGQVGKIVFLLSRRAVFADEPGLVPRQMLLTLVPDPLRWSVGRAHRHTRKAGFELSLRAGAVGGELVWARGLREVKRRFCALPLSPRTVHLCIDMQRIFSPEGPWSTP